MAGKTKNSPCKSAMWAHPDQPPELLKQDAIALPSLASPQLSYAPIRAGQRRLTGESAQGCLLMVRRVVRTKAEWTLVPIARFVGWSGSLTTASLVTLRSELSR